jgi:hypothetical protein
MEAAEFEARIEAVNIALDAMQVAAQNEGRDIAATIAGLRRERDVIIRNFYRTFEDRFPPEEPPGGSLVGARIKPVPPTRTGVDAKPFPPENDTVET